MSAGRQPPGRQDPGGESGRGGSGRKAPKIPTIGTLALPRGGGFTPSRMLAGSGWSLGASSGLCGRVQGTQQAALAPPGCCAVGTSLPARDRLAVSCLPAQQPGFGQPCFPSRSPPRSVLLSQASRSPWRRAHCCGTCCTARGATVPPDPLLVRRWPQRDQAGHAARTRGLWVRERPPQGARDVGYGCVPRGAAALTLGAGESLSCRVRAASKGPVLSLE